MVGVLRAMVEQVQELEVVWYDILTKVNINEGVGDQLDLVGAWLGVPRYGLSDATYRVRLRVEILVRNSYGTMNDLLGIMVAALALETGVTVTLEEPSPATALATIIGTVPAGTSELILGFLNRARALGVKLFLQNIFDNPFTLADTGAEELDTTHGWGDDGNPATGGKLSGVV
jgi:hypothetical protein